MKNFLYILFFLLFLNQNIQSQNNFMIRNYDDTENQERYRSREWDEIFQHLKNDRSPLPYVDYDRQRRNIIDNNLDGCQYLIVCPNNQEISEWADTLAKFRNEQGIFTKVVNVKDFGNKPIDMNKFFKEIYQEWDLVPSAILLFGDYSTDENKGISSFRLSNHPETNINYLSDNKLVDFNNDNLPEMVIARMPVANAQQAELMVRKTIRYETRPSIDPNYYDKLVTAMGYEEDRWFQLCSEVIAGYFETQGKNPTRLNSIISGAPDSVWSTNTNTDAVIDYFGPNGLNYIPSNIRHLTNWDADMDDVSNAINEGCFIVQHRAHGSYQKWEYPNFTNDNINNLNNEDLTFIMSANCRTGGFDYGSGDNDCFAERFLRVEKGAVAVVAASETSYSFVNDTYVWGFYDYLWNDFMPYGNNETTFKYPAFANAYGKYFLRQSTWPHIYAHKDVTYNLFHYFGDAYLQLNTEMPQEIAISYPKEILTHCDTIIIKKDQYTRVALSVDGEIIATSFGDDSIVSIRPFYKEGKIKIVATKQNHYRHEDYIEVKSKLNDFELNIYPNPVNDMLFVEGKGIIKVEIYNTLGQKLMEINNEGFNEKIELDCNRLKKGLFHLHIIYEDKRVGKSFIVM